MDVRVAVDSDAEPLARLHVRGWQLGYRGMLPQSLLDSLDPADRVERWRGSIAGADLPHRGCLVVEEDGRLLGFAHVWPSSDADFAPGRVGEVSSFYVEPDQWRTGVGRLLMTAALDLLERAGYDEAALYVLDGNERAIGFYTALGWWCDGVTKDDVRGEYTFLDVRYRHDLGSAPRPSTGSGNVR